MDLASPLLYAQVSLGVLVALCLGAVVFGWVRSPLDGGGARAFALPVLGRLRLYATKSSFAATLALREYRGQLE